LDMLAPEVCLECIWVEAVKRHNEPFINGAASEAFSTEDFIGQIFICFFIKEESILKCIRIKFYDSEYPTLGPLTTIPCLYATNIDDRNLMAVIELDSSLVFYSGTLRIGLLHLQQSPNTHLLFPSSQNSTGFFGNVSLCLPVISVRKSYPQHLILQSFDQKYYICKVPAFTMSCFISECISNICSLLPIEKALKFSSSWYLNNNWYLIRTCHYDQLLMETMLLIQFTFAQCGLHLENFAVFKQVSIL
uniref:Anaphase-promoting complex subunit 1 n=1 Tax=Dracunculus medinensis TaxID=318479 RepID=A0A0N4U6M1_DRAME